MKYSVNSRQDLITLRKADEIIIKGKDIESFPVLFEKLPEKNFILDFNEENPSAETLDKIKVWRGWTENIVIRTYDLSNIGTWCKDNNIKFYASFSASTFYECNALKDFGVEYITITMPLTHSMKCFNNFPVKLRMVPNIAYYAFIPRVHGLYGQWVRPEDVKYYENVYIFDFEDCDLQKEKTLLKVYKEDEEWPGNLNLLISNLDVNVNNITIPKELGETRANCRQKCQDSGHCKFCETAINFSNTLYELKKDAENRNKLI